MKIFWSYIKTQKRFIAILILFFLIYTFSFFLYHLPIEAVLYPTFLCALFSVFFFFIHYRTMLKKHRELEQIQRQPIDMITEFPPVTHISERDYQNIILSMQEQYRQITNENTLRSQERNDYFMMWVHQIKSPIAAMKIHLQEEDSGKSRMLQTQLTRIEQYVEMVLTYLHLENRNSDYVLRLHAADDLVRRAVKKFSGEFIDRKITLDYQKINCQVITDEKWLVFVLEQLLSNALKYTPKGYIRIYESSPGILCIEDSGIGIAPEDLPRVFEMGFTGFNGRKDQHASGIGLHLCKRICDCLGHVLRIESQISVGTSVFLNLNQHRITQE